MDVNFTPGAPLSAVDQSLVDGVLAQERRALAKTITLLESTRADHQVRAQRVLTSLLPHTGKAIRIGISGVPGAGKSTFIESLGLHLVDQGMRLAVLAVDPSSSVSGGSILGDKTRMEMLCQRQEAFIRPSPSAGSLGGVADKTREAMLVCEASGYDVIIVETVGVGQSETTVAGMVDMFVLIQLPNSGDDLQAIKKGIVEIADLIVFNKADIDPRAAEFAKSQMRTAMTLLRPASPNWRPPVLTLSALAKQGIPEFWAEIERFRSIMTKSGELESKRRRQSVDWMWNMIDSGLRLFFREFPAVHAALPGMSRDVAEGRTTPGSAAQKLLGFLKV